MKPSLCQEGYIILHKFNLKFAWGMMVQEEEDLTQVSHAIPTPAVMGIRIGHKTLQNKF